MYRHTKKHSKNVAYVTILVLTTLLSSCNSKKPEPAPVKNTESSDSVAYQKTTTYEFDSDEVEGDMKKPDVSPKPTSPLQGSEPKANSPEKPTHTDNNNNGIQKPTDAGPKKVEH